MKEIEVEVASQGEDWPLFKAGLFNGSVERFQEIKIAFDTWILNMH